MLPRTRHLGPDAWVQSLRECIRKRAWRVKQGSEETVIHAVWLEVWFIFFPFCALLSIRSFHIWINCGMRPTEPPRGCDGESFNTLAVGRLSVSCREITCTRFGRDSESQNMKCSNRKWPVSSWATFHCLAQQLCFKPGRWPDVPLRLNDSITPYTYEKSSRRRAQEPVKRPAPKWARRETKKRRSPESVPDFWSRSLRKMGHDLSEL